MKCSGDQDLVALSRIKVEAKQTLLAIEKSSKVFLGDFILMSVLCKYRKVFAVE